MTDVFRFRESLICMSDIPILHCQQSNASSDRTYNEAITFFITRYTLRGGTPTQYTDETKLQNIWTGLESIHELTTSVVLTVQSK